MMEPRTVIVPEETELTQPFWDGARAHELRLQHCDDCARVWHPPLPLCPGCGSAKVTWRAAQGTGVVYSVTVTHQAAHPAFASRVPYAVVVVRLTEGVLIVGNVLDAAPSDVAIGQAVTVAFDEIAPGVTLPQFALARQGPPSV